MSDYPDLSTSPKVCGVEGTSFPGNYYIAKLSGANDDHPAGEVLYLHSDGHWRQAATHQGEATGWYLTREAANALL